MKRVQRTVRLHPDLDKELQAKASGDVSVTEIIESALSRHFRREAIDVQIEHLTRKQGAMVESIDKLGAHQLTLQKKIDTITTQVSELAQAVAALNTAVAEVKAVVEHTGQDQGNQKRGLFGGLR
jgi:septal ring factor EnvC (AmiA/AmiB activator)